MSGRSRLRQTRLAVQALEARENPASIGGFSFVHHWMEVSSPVVTEGGVATFVVTPIHGHPAINSAYQTFEAAPTSGVAAAEADEFQPAAGGGLTWAAGDNTPKTVSVVTNDDAIFEPTERFGLRIIEAVGGGLQAVGFGKIKDNDPQPTMSVGDVTGFEGSSGGSTPFAFPITLTNPASTRVSVLASPVGRTATAAAGDYAVQPMRVDWAPGETGTKYYTVYVKADKKVEPNETFGLKLSQPSLGTITRTVGTGTILNDDSATPPPPVNPPPAKTVAGVFRSGQWFLDTAGDGTFAERIVNFGLPGDTAVSADWNRDGRTDLTVVRQNWATYSLDWYVDLNLDGQTDFVKHYGWPGDVPVAGDFDGNGTTDMGAVRKNPGSGLFDWYLDLANNGGNAEAVVGFGLISGDVPVPADWNRDGRTDLAVYRAGSSYQTGGQWIINLPGGFQTLALGNAGWSPVVGDFNGDGNVDAGLWRHNPERGGLDWLIDLGHDGSIDTGLQYGLPGDQVLAGAWS